MLGLRLYWATTSAVVAAVLWGSIGVVVRLAEGAGGSVDVLIVGRALGASILSLPILARYRARLTVWGLAIALLGLAPLYYTYMKAVSLIGAALASLLLYTAPLWVVILGSMILGERPGIGGLASIALGVTGTALVSGVFNGGLGALDPRGLIYGLASGVSYALYMILARLAQNRGVGVLEASLTPVTLTGLILLVAIHPQRPPNTVELTASLYLAGFTVILPYILHVYALKHIEAHRVSIISLIEPVSAVTLAYLILGERLDRAQLLGAALIITATLTVNIGRQGKQGKHINDPNNAIDLDGPNEELSGEARIACSHKR